MAAVNVINDLKGHVLIDVIKNNDGEIIFTRNDGRRFMMYHEQDCCESVYIESIDGELSYLIGSRIEMAEEVIDGDEDDGCTWTFYKFGTIKGYVTIRWVGESNGYYSESVDWTEIDPIAVQDPNCI